MKVLLGIFVVAVLVIGGVMLWRQQGRNVGGSSEEALYANAEYGYTISIPTGYTLVSEDDQIGSALMVDIENTTATSGFGLTMDAGKLNEKTPFETYLESRRKIFKKLDPGIVEKVIIVADVDAYQFMQGAGGLCQTGSQDNPEVSCSSVATLWYKDGIIYELSGTLLGQASIESAPELTTYSKVLASFRFSENSASQ